MPRLKKLESNQGDPRSQVMMHRLEKNRNLLNIFRSMANSPACLDGYLKFATALKEGALDARTREAISLVVAQAHECEYSLSAHTPLAREAGLCDETIRHVRQGRAADKKLHAAVALAKKVVDSRGAVSDADLRSARAAGLDDGMIAEVVANVALNVFTNYFNQVNQTEIDLPHVPATLPANDESSQAPSTAIARTQRVRGAARHTKTQPGAKASASAHL